LVKENRPLQVAAVEGGFLVRVNKKKTSAGQFNQMKTDDVRTGEGMCNEEDVKEGRADDGEKKGATKHFLKDGIEGTSSSRALPTGHPERRGVA